VDVSIKDIAARIKGCSEKTIQRELNALLYDNIIERIGEKRWSRYVSEVGRRLIGQSFRSEIFTWHDFAF
jgi:DNA-binding HxlR family transcriptional regulator